MRAGKPSMKRLRFVWIDDKTQKVEAYRPAIENRPKESKLSASVDVLQVRTELLQQLETWANSWQASPPDLIIIDHVFNLALPLGLKGSSVAHLLRGKFPAVPMVCVTARLDSPNAVDQEDLAEYTAIFPYTRLDDYIDDLFAIARDFTKLRASGSNVRQHLVACLRAPARDRNDLLRVLPEEFQNKRPPTTEHRMAQWVYNVLLQRPGFLYDNLNAATLLGLTEAGFSLVERKFIKARYRGIFEMESKPRWWVSELRQVLFSIVPTSGLESSQLAGRTLAGIKPQHYSKCYVSKAVDPPPDTIVYVDATSDAERRVVRHEFSAPHPLDLGLRPGFEGRLVLKRRSK
jgi:hypothetical protein